jgi:hypothetical protein
VNADRPHFLDDGVACAFEHAEPILMRKQL